MLRRLGGLDLPDDPAQELLLWQAQQGVLIGKIDARQRALIACTAECWRLPYEYQRPESGPAETVDRPEFPQLGHLARTAPVDQAAKTRLHLLKSARANLSHLRFLSATTIREVLKQPI